MSSKLGQTRPQTAELAALERLKNRYIMLSTLLPFSFDRIFIFAGNKDNYKVSNEFEIRSDPIIDYGVSCP